ncbi:MAG: hypothetical protein PHO32_08545 [Candidatus Cloacimonetes bacterium]|nr:hypothetical protein [Candidatus Cloacimonadota bacterium]
MRHDLKILFWLMVITLMLFSVYKLVDYTFDALDKPSTTIAFKSFQSSFTNTPTEEVSEGVPSQRWKPDHYNLPIIGSVHKSIVYLITGIFAVAMLGFWIIYFFYRKES